MKNVCKENKNLISGIYFCETWHIFKTFAYLHIFPNHIKSNSSSKMKHSNQEKQQKMVAETYEINIQPRILELLEH